MLGTRPTTTDRGGRLMVYRGRVRHGGWSRRCTGRPR